MKLDTMMSVFSGLIEGTVPDRLREPMGEMFAEICGKVSFIQKSLEDSDKMVNSLCSKVEEFHSKVLSLEGSIDQKDHENVRLTNDLSWYASQPKPEPDSDFSAIPIVRAMVDSGLLSKNSLKIRDAIVAHYQCYDSKIKVIKAYRQMTGMGLKAAKEQVEAWIDGRCTS